MVRIIRHLLFRTYECVLDMCSRSDSRCSQTAWPKDDDAIVDEGRRGGGQGGSMAQITINEGLAWLKTLKKRHEELLTLRNDNAHRERRFYGASADKEIVKEPVYDVKTLDRVVTRVAREIRLLDQALKATNAKTM